ncbi:MAG: ATP-binding protein [Candidatus Omnitrophica bacterium]|nr:ATP-binding protein [Candidatus Omnitrophota bacterium]
MKYYKREIEPVLLTCIKSFPGVVLTGPRQSGKSTLLKNTFPKYQYITFDDISVLNFAKTDPKSFLNNLEEKFILDEIQYCPEILSYLKIKIDENPQLNERFLLTGSQQFSMMKNLAETLAGRVALLELLSFSYFEKEHIKSEIKSSNVFVKMCVDGSYPGVLLKADKENKSNWYKSYLSTYLERDIKNYYGVGNILQFHKLLQLLAGRCAQILNYSDLAVSIGVTVATIQNWISVLVNSKIVYILKPYHENFGKRVIKSPKVYFLDTGFLCYLLGIERKEQVYKSYLAGNIFENFCVEETIKTIINSGKRDNVFFVRTSNQLEVDLLLEIKDELIPIEFKMSMTQNPEMAVNLQKFRELFPKLNLGQGMVVSLDDEKQLLKGSGFLGVKEYLSFVKKTYKP